MIRDKEVAFEIFRKVVIRVVETEKVDWARIVGIWRRSIRTL